MNRYRTVIVACLCVLFTCSFSRPALASTATPVTCSSPALASPEPTEYFVSLADAARHLAHVSIRLNAGNGVRTLDMPVWNAIYQVRNFAANIEDLRA